MSNVSEKDIDKRIDELNKKLKKYKNVKVLNPTVYIFLWIFITFICFFSGDQEKFVIAYILCIPIVIFSMFSSRKKNKIINNIKQKYKQNFIEELYSGISYSSNDIEAMKESCILYQFTKFYDEGCLRFSNQNSNIKMDFFKTTKEIKSDKGIEELLVDEGCLITIDNILKPPIDPPVLLIPRYRNDNIIEASKIFKDDEILWYFQNPVTDFEDQLFNDWFKVICSNEQYAYQILSLDLIDRIISLKKRYKKEIKISYIGDKMYIYIQKLNFFEMNHSNKLGFTLNKEKILEFHKILVNLSEIAEQLCPNREIYKGGY